MLRLTFLMLALGTLTVASSQQGIGISDSGPVAPHSSSVLDVQSTQRGVLLPRMTTAQRLAIATPAPGLVVFDETTGSFWLFQGGWNELVVAQYGLRDQDQDTKVEVERFPDDDLVRVQVEGKAIMHVDSSGLRLGASDGSVYIGLGAGALTVPVGAMLNTFVGESAGALNDGGFENTFIGAHAGTNNTDGTSNTFVGHSAGSLNTLGINNTFVGSEAGASATLGLGNAFLGYRAGFNNTVGGLNTLIGALSGEDLVNTSRNVFVGQRSGQHNQGSDNTFLGYSAGRQDLGVLGGGSQSVIIGSEAGLQSVGTDNTFVGYAAGRDNATLFGSGLRNVMVGAQAGQMNGGTDNTLIGYSAGSNNASENMGNVMLGSESGLNALGDLNTFLGTAAGKNGAGGNSNVMIGFQAGHDASGEGNILIGKDAGRSQDSIDHSVMIGYETGMSNLATGNTFIGGKAGRINTTGQNNTFVGLEAGSNSFSGTNNTFVGMNAGAATGSSDGNTFIGSHSGWTNAHNAAENTFVGMSSGAFNEGDRNAFVGYSAGCDNDGNDNVFIGHNAGSATTTGSLNIYVGSGAGANSSGSGNVFLGYQAGMNETGDQKLYIDNSSTAAPLILGDFDFNALDITGDLRISDNPFAGTTFPSGQGMELSYVDELNTGYIQVIDADEGANGDLFLGHSVMIGVLSQDPNHRFTMPNNSVFGAALANTWDTYSDRRIKSEISTVPYGLVSVMALQPVRYFQHDAAIVDGTIALESSGRYRTGFIAQQVHQVISEAVTVPADEQEALWSLDYDALVPVLVKAIQELSEEVSQVKSELRALQAARSQ
ncbi:MAG: tail fiber domain-containing protein [Saprospiraceae bacterium]|nr:tail fiber domain-containing protein [Saprospiraceae bacterium]